MVACMGKAAAMQQQKFTIKGMVCERCILSVREALENLGVKIVEIHLGEATLLLPPDVSLPVIESRLQALGFSLLPDKKARLVAATKALVNEVYSGSYDFPLHFRFSALAAEKLNASYDVISTAFSSLEQITLEQYIINFRIEKTKELLVYTSNSLSHIALALGFSSVAHLSRQFKAHTGLTTSHFRAIKQNKEASKPTTTGA